MIATYISANSFKVSGNKTGEFVVDRRIKADCGDDGEVIATIVSSSYNGTSSETTVVIDETGLTSNLIGVLYGVVAPGATGSMPIHPHDGSEGSGGSVGGGGSSTFLGLTDTPSSFDDGKYLKSTVSGTEWATVSGGAAPGDYVEYDFGSRTISGTGDIHCNDIYTSSGTVYIGGLKLSSPDGTNLYLNDTQTAISGSDGADGADGNTWTVASGTPVGVANTVGDMYLDDSNYDIYQATSLSGTVVYGTTDLCTGGTANASAIYSAGYEAYRAFDDNTGTWWNSPAGAGPHWIGYELTSARPAGKVTILHYSTGIYANEWKFQGTNDTESDWDSKVWVDLGTVTYSSAPSGVQTHEFGNQVAYKYYRLISVTVIGNEWPVREIEFFESLISDVYELVGNIKGADGQDFSGSATLSGLADTPSGYDDGKYLRSTSSGTEWATVSGTGGGSSDVQTFLDLTDTPTTYSGADGKYLRVTSSGVEFADVMEGKSSWEVQAGAPTGSSEADNLSFDKESKGVYIYVPTYEYRDNVKLLLDFNGNFSDSSDSGHTMSEFGDVSIDTTNKKFGTGSAYFDGTGDYLQAPSSSDFDLSSSNWTIECWIRHANVGSYGRTIWAPSSNYDGIGLNYDSGRIKYSISSNGSNWNIVNSANGNKTSWSSGVWYHVAVTWDGSTYRGFVDGVLDFTISSSTGLYSGFTPRIGCWDNGTGFWYGNIDQFIVYKGVALYTSNFTPATSPIEISDDTGWQLTGTVAEHEIVITTFSGLSDTPNDYQTGKYLVSTASGTEWNAITDETGTVWYLGEGVPDQEVGDPNDYYLDKDTKDLYVKDTLSGTNIVGDGTVSSPSGGVTDLDRLYDGSTATYTTGGTTGSENGAADSIVQVDFGAGNDVVVKRTRRYSHALNKCSLFTVDGSHDASDWTNIYEVDSEPEDLIDGTQTYTAKYGTNMSNAVDGNINTNWDSSTYDLTQWWQVDMGITVVANYFGTYTTANRNKVMRIDGSNNESDWTTLATISKGTATQWNYASSSNTTAYRYYRIWFTEQYYGNKPNLGEFVMYNMVEPGWDDSGILDNDTAYRYYRLKCTKADSTFALAEWELYGNTFVWDYKTKTSDPGPTTFLELTDTPTTYSGSEGKFMVATAYGLEFSDFSTGYQTSNFKAYEVMGDYALDDETLDVTLSGVQGDTYTDWALDFHFKNTSGGDGTRLLCQLNGDTTNTNYDQLSIAQNGGAVTGGESDPASTSWPALYISHAYQTDRTVAGKADLFLKSGIPRMSFSVARTSKSSDNELYIAGSSWKNTANEVTTMRVFTQTDVTGYLRIYRLTTVDLPVSSGGAGSLTPFEYKTEDFTSTAGGRYQCDTVSGTITMTLPDSPTAMDEILVEDASGNFATNNLLVSGTENIRGVADTLTLDVDWASVNLVYINDTVGWRY
jgi:hypothetical protein